VGDSLSVFCQSIDADYGLPLIGDWNSVPCQN
jgi:hypothetical protein